jgi:hypothetical protein
VTPLQRHVGKSFIYTVHWAFFWLALTAIGALGLRAATTLDTTWDALAYHLPFAARFAGLCDLSCYVMSGELELRFRSFPPLADMLLGLFWRMSGRPEAANLVSFLSLVLLTLYVARVWAVPWGVLTVATLAIPIVPIFATSSYIDLTVNVAATVCALVLLRLALKSESFNVGTAVLFCVSMVFLGNSKTQMIGLAALFGVAFVALICSQTTPINMILAGRFRAVLGIAFIAALAVATNATTIRNLIEFGNPFYPVRIAVGWFLLPGVSDPIASNSVADYLRSSSGPVRWLLSLLEYRAYDARYTPWVLSQGDVAQSEASFRMGGYFGVYVLQVIGLLLLAVRFSHPRTKRIVLWFVFLTTIATAVQPAAHELRYYMFYMLCLVIVTLHLIYNAAGDDTLRYVTLLVVASCFSAVTFLSGGYWFVRGNSAEETVVGTGIRQNIATIRDGSTVCIPNVRVSFLYAKVFHPGRDYRTIEGMGSQCDATFK